MATEFAERLARLRREGGYGSGREFARALGISDLRYAQFEQGAAEPDLETICRICRALDTSADVLLGLVPEPKEKLQ